MKAKILEINGKEKGTIELPSCFSSNIREDIVSKIVEAKKREQPYSPSPMAGKQHAAKGKVVHRRHVWRSGYGRGMSRVPRKIFSQKGSQFNWEAAEVPFARGGRRAHPPKVIARMNPLKINKKEMRIGLQSALSATANQTEMSKRYERLKDKKIEKLPFVAESKITSLKFKELLSGLKNILGGLFELAIKKKKVRSGKGKLRGRKYKSNAGLLIVIGNDEKMNTSRFDVKKAKDVNILDLARGGLGRLTLYTEKAIKNLGE